MRKIILFILVISIPFIGFSQEEKEQPSKWELELTPYLWATGMNGHLAIGDQTAKVDVDFTDVVQKLKIAGMIHAEVKKDRWSIMTDLFYANLNQKNDTQDNGLIETNIKQTSIELGGGYSFIKLNTLTIDALFGARYFNMEIDVDQTDINSISVEDNFIDPFIGLRFSNYWNKFGISGRIDVGGFGVGSEVSYKYNLMTKYKFSELFELNLGYQAYNPLYDNGKNLVYDISTEGLLLGLNFTL